MLIRLKNGRVYDPMRRKDGVVEDIYIKDGRIVSAPTDGQTIKETYDLRGHVVMAGAIDIHTHLAGGKVNAARALLSDDHHHCHHLRDAYMPFSRSGSGHILPTSHSTGYQYAAMGYTSCFEPAMLPSNARQAHAEMSDIPIIDRGAYVLLGNDDLLLTLLAKKRDKKLIRDYIAWTINASQAIAVKVVNPGGINAFKFNQRTMDLDEPHRHYGITPRQILKTLTEHLEELGIPHPLHVHGCNLGIPGNDKTTLDTMQATEGLPIHLTHIQFHSYGTEGDRRFSSAASKIAERINQNPNISVDVGQIIFGQTVTTSGDIAAQYRSSAFAHPKRWTAIDIECDAACGVVPFLYRDKNFVNALQWCIGLELFLMVEDPWRIFLTTDHPNGAPFTCYPHLIRLLMDKTFRREMIASINPEAAKASVLSSLTREYTLYEIAVLTRAGPAKSLGLSDRGYLAPGAIADITVYRNQKNREAMFAKPRYVFKDGALIAKDGKLLEMRPGNLHTVKPSYDPAIERYITRYCRDYLTVSAKHLKVSNDEITKDGGKILVHNCRKERQQ